MEIPLVYPIRQQQSQPQVADIPAEVRRQILRSRLRERVKSGANVAVGVGSRGIANIAVIAKATVDTVKELGFSPFVVAAMGSHGGATAEGQRQLLADYGVHEKALGVPVRTDMNTVQLGANSWGETVYWDRNAFNADAVVTISRVKQHTDFGGPFESGIVKMIVIGLGKRDGASQHHQYGVRGLRDMIPETAKVVLEKTKFAMGLAVVENANEETALIQAVEREELFATEPKLLAKAREWMPRIPFDQFDLLIIGEMGKNYSGTGMDVNVLGRRMVEGEKDPLKPNITRICILDLSDESHGNATGVGIADLTTVRLLKKMSAEISHINTLTACFLLRSKTPIELPNDKGCIETGLKTCWQPKHEKLKMALIPNTLELSQLWVSKPLVDEARNCAELQVSDEPISLPFDSDGNLKQEVLFPHSVRTRRMTR